mgnify:CR=1 FL=1
MKERRRLYTENLVKRYRNRTVVKGVSVEVSQGEIVGLLGPNGAGKTTTFYMILGLINPDGGQIFFDQHNISNLPVYKRARLGIGYLPQEASIFRKLTVGENLRAILEYRDITEAEIECFLEDIYASEPNKRDWHSLFKSHLESVYKFKSLVKKSKDKYKQENNN